MPSEPDKLGVGLEVLGADGEVLGKIARVWPAVSGEDAMGMTPDASEFAATEDSTAGYEEARVLEQVEARGTLAGDIGDASAPGPDVITPGIGGGYFEVESGGGLFGLGSTSLYIPFSAVQTVTPGESVTLLVAAAEARDLYGHKPAFLD